jgi:hypothetical protein
MAEGSLWRDMRVYGVKRFLSEGPDRLAFLPAGIPHSLPPRPPHQARKAPGRPYKEMTATANIAAG